MPTKLNKLYAGTRAICEVFEGDDGRHYLSVICPALAWYNSGAIMTPEEVLEFRARPEAVEDLAISICKDPGAFKDRALPQDIYETIWAPYK
jgi:hypothetical protein